MPLARSYNYNPAAFLIALRRAGLTSLALTEELGANVGDRRQGVRDDRCGARINQARISPLSRSDAGRDGVAKAGNRPPMPSTCSSTIRLTYDRYREQLALHFDAEEASAFCARRRRGSWRCGRRSIISIIRRSVFRPTRSRSRKNSGC